MSNGHDETNCYKVIGYPPVGILMDVDGQDEEDELLEEEDKATAKAEPSLVS